MDQSVPWPRIRKEVTRAARPPLPRSSQASRRADWELCLRRAVKNWSTRSFKWGKSDCVHFVCACIESMTGVDYLADIKTYSSEREALEVLASVDHRGLQQAVEIGLGPSEEITPDLKPFRTGDVLLTMRPVVGRPRRRGPGLGIGIGAEALFVGASGLEKLPVSDCICGWRIG